MGKSGSNRFAFCFVAIALTSCSESGTFTPSAFFARVGETKRLPPTASLNSKSVLHDFGKRPDGHTPLAGLLGSNGEFFGTTYGGGERGLGSVFEISGSGNERVLYSFKGGSDGENPAGGLIADNEGNLYGTTEYGGNWGACGKKFCGTVFELRRLGTKYKELRLYVFKDPRDGEFPMGALLLGKNDVLYGTTNTGGNGLGQCDPAFCGTIFALTPSGKGYIKKIVYSFQGSTDGAYPSGSLIANESGTIYGTTEFGGGANADCASSPSGAASCGTVYKVTPGGFETLLHRFRGGKHDGANPAAGLLAGNNGVVYGVTEYGGGTASGPGTVFELTLTSRRHAVSILHTFCSVSNCADGERPVDSEGLRSDDNGDLYGTTQLGGNRGCGCGNVFMLHPSGSKYVETVLHDFLGKDGAQPSGSVLLAGKNDVWGTTAQGGTSSTCSHGCGVIYEIRP
jgi:uncharacterized repeat protein (TIGR03803 family)